MHRYFIQLAYDGASYHGWQIQKNAHTVQAELNKQLAILLLHPTETTGCGRTDTGVHAKVFFAHFDSERLLANKAKDKKTVLHKLNRMLPSDIVVQDIFEVASGFHARFDAVERTYHYYIHQQKDPFLEKRSYYVYEKLNLAKMQKATEALLLYKDFSSFSKSRTQVKTNLCVIKQASWTVHNGQWLFSITADRFLRNMVRAIVGTLLAVGKEKISVSDFKKVIEGKKRSLAGVSVSAHALYLTEVKYENL